MRSIEEIRQEIRETLERYYRLEAELRQLERGRFRVCIFGSARIRPEDPIYRMVYEMARKLADLDIDIVTGGGPGLMEAANRAVHDSHNQRAKSIGLPIILPRAQELANKHLDIKSEHRRFSSRLDEFMRLSHAVIVAPGGIGTLLELMYVWQLIQVGMVEVRPVILLDRSFWDGLLEWMREKQLGRGLISPWDFDWIHPVATPDDALVYIRAALEKYRQQQAQRPETAHHAAEAERKIAELDRIRGEAAPGAADGTSQRSPAAPARSEDGGAG